MEACKMLEEFKEKVTISTNKSSQNAKELLINPAIFKPSIFFSKLSFFPSGKIILGIY